MWVEASVSLYAEGMAGMLVARKALRLADGSAAKSGEMAVLSDVPKAEETEKTAAVVLTSDVTSGDAMLYTIAALVNTRLVSMIRIDMKMTTTR